MSEGGDRSIDLDVLDADGEHIGRVDGVPFSTLARCLPVTLDDDAQEALDVPEALIELPSQLIRRRSGDEVHLSQNLAEIKERLAGLGLDEG